MFPEMYRGEADDSLVAPSEAPSTDPDYWHGTWYQDIKAMVYTVAVAMHNNGVDPALISAEDAWAHMAGNVRATHRRIELGGTKVPQEFKDFAKADSAGGRVFMAMWEFYDLHKLIAQGVGAY